MFSKPIAEDKQGSRGWKLELNGEPVEEVTSLRLTNNSFGTLEYGATPAGYDGWCFEEKGGGGSVIVPYFVLDEVDQDYPAAGRSQLYIGLVQQDRYTMGGLITNLPRGFLAEDETHFEAARREGGEEFRFNLADRFSELPGSPTNWNSAFAVTLGDDKGVRFFSLDIKSNEVKLADEDGGVYTLRDDVLKSVSKVGEQIFGSSFVPYTAALRSNDMFTVAGVGRLLPVIEGRL